MRASKKEYFKHPESTEQERTAQPAHNSPDYHADLAAGGGKTTQRPILSLASEPGMGFCLQERAPIAAYGSQGPAHHTLRHLPLLLCQAAPGLWPHLPHPVTPMIPTVASKHSTISNNKTKGRNSSPARFQLHSAELLQHCLVPAGLCFPNSSWRASLYLTFHCSMRVCAQCPCLNGRTGPKVATAFPYIVFASLSPFDIIPCFSLPTIQFYGVRLG